MMLLFPYKKGFTLLELLIYLAVVGILGFSLFALLGVVQEIKGKQQAIREVEEQGILISRMIANHVRGSEGIQSPLPEMSANDLLINLEGGVNTVHYTLQGTTLQRQDNFGSPLPLLSNRVLCTSFAVEHISVPNSPPQIHILMTLSYSQLGQARYSYEKTFPISVTSRAS